MSSPSLNVGSIAVKSKVYLCGLINGLIASLDLNLHNSFQFVLDLQINHLRTQPSLKYGLTASLDLNLRSSFQFGLDLQINHLCTRLSLKRMEQNVLEQILDGSMKPRHLPLETLRIITNDFSVDRIIGEGGFSTVYKGIVGNMNVAVKKIKSSMTINQKFFRREVGSQMDVNHENVVRFLGLCSHTEEALVKDPESQRYILADIRERLLCFEYVGNENLGKYITDESTGLDWDTRYKIIKGICTGLHYLHTEKHLLHMDLKPSNILLDNRMVPKITDFGLSRPMENAETMTTSNYSSLGYGAPENLSGTKSVKSDIFSLGAIIIELVTGSKGNPGNNNILRWSQRWKKSAEETPLEYYEQVTECIEIGSLCWNIDPDARPSISQIMSKFVELESRKEKRVWKAAEEQQRTDEKVEALTINLDQMTTERQRLEEDMRKAAEKQQSSDKEIGGLTMKLDQMIQERERLEAEAGIAAEKQQSFDTKMEVSLLKLEKMTQERERLEEDAAVATEKQKMSDEKIEVLTMKLDQMTQKRQSLEEDARKTAEKQLMSDKKIEVLTMKLDQMIQERQSLEEDARKAADKQQGSDKNIEVLMMKLEQMTQEKERLEEVAGKATEKQQLSDETIEALMTKLNQVTQERERLEEDVGKAAEKQQRSDEKIEVLTTNIDEMTQERQHLQERLRKAIEEQEDADTNIELLTMKLDQKTQEKQRWELEMRLEKERQRNVNSESGN